MAALRTEPLPAERAVSRRATGDRDWKLTRGQSLLGTRDQAQGRVGAPPASHAEDRGRKTGGGRGAGKIRAP
jgi:hypothetical protein